MKWLQIAVLLALTYPACEASKRDLGRDIDGGSEAGASGEAGANSEAGAGAEAGLGEGGALGSGGSSGSASGGMSGGGSCQMSLCAAKQVDTATQACGACKTGKQTHTRTCSADQCSWGPWSAWSACTAACTPGQTTSCPNGDSCGQRVCSDSCSWGGCAPKVAGGCLRIRDGHTDEGSNYQCCGTEGHWQFCNPSCKWNAACAACSKGSPDYCTECY